MWRSWGFAVGLGCSLRLLEGAGGVLVGLAREFVGGERALAMRCRGCGVGMSSKAVQLGGAVVNALGHVILLSAVRCGRGARGVSVRSGGGLQARRIRSAAGSGGKGTTC